MAVKPPSGIQSGISNLGITNQTTGAQVGGPAKAQAPQTQAATPVVNSEAAAKAFKDYKKLRDKLKAPFMSGAASLFTDNVVFPADLLDPQNPANDVKYLHLLTAVVGMKELSHFYATEEQQKEIEEVSGQDQKATS